MRRFALFASLALQYGCGASFSYLDHYSGVMGSSPGPYVIRAEGYDPTDALIDLVYIKADSFCNRRHKQVETVKLTEDGMSIWQAMTIAIGAKVTLVFNCTEITAEDRVTTEPKPGKALIVFLNPDGGTTGARFFRIDAGTPELVGFVDGKEKVAYQVSPGKHLFMVFVFGEGPEFMFAEVNAGKTYYALLRFRSWAIFAPAFELLPVTRPDQDRAQLNQWLESCVWVRKTPAMEAWASKHRVDVVEKEMSNYEKWIEKREGNPPRLTPEDGV